MKLQNEETLLRGTCTRHHVQSLHPPNATNSTRQGRYTAAMRAVATVAVSACFLLVPIASAQFSAALQAAVIRCCDAAYCYRRRVMGVSVCL